MGEKLYNLAEDIANAFYVEIVASESTDDIVNILEDDICNDLEKILEKIKYYGNKISN